MALLVLCTGIKKELHVSPQEEVSLLNKQSKQQECYKDISNHGEKIFFSKRTHISLKLFSLETGLLLIMEKHQIFSYLLLKIPILEQKSHGELSKNYTRANSNLLRGMMVLQT